MPLRAVSFDAGGTLFHTARPVGELYGLVAARHGIALAAEDVSTRFHAALVKAPPLAFPDVPAPEIRARERAWWRNLVASVVAGTLPVSRFDAYFDDLFEFFATPAAWRVDSDAPALLHQLRRQGLAVLVVSNFDSRLRRILQALGLAPLIDSVTISSEAGAAKPDPRIFTVALRSAGLSPTEVIHVGDTARDDLVAGRAAGLDVILVAHGSPPIQTTAMAVVPRLGDVLRLIRSRTGAA